MAMKDKNNPILVPVDFSPRSETALIYAAELSDKLGCKLIVLHVVHDPGDAPGYYSVKGRDKQLRRMEDVAAEMLDEYLRKMRKNNPVLPALEHARTMLVIGLPVNRILESAKKVHAQMIVMSSQGRTGLAHVLLGSKAEQVVRLAPIPVTIVKHREKRKA